MRYVRNFLRVCLTALVVGLILTLLIVLSQYFDWRIVSVTCFLEIVLVVLYGARTMEAASESYTDPPLETSQKQHRAKSKSTEASKLRYASVEVTYDNDDVFEHVRRNLNDEYDDYAIGVGKTAKLDFFDHLQTVVVAGRGIRGPIYLADLKRSRGDQYPAVIDKKLKVKWDGQPEPLSYWPSYKNLSAIQRGAYLVWLTGDRGFHEEIGYAFLYFYGLERYVLEDAKADEHDRRTERLSFIFGELKRLQSFFPNNRSFQGYSERLMESIAGRYMPEALQQLKTNLPEREAIALRYHLAQLAESGSTEALDSDWVVQWLIYAGELPRSKALKAHYQSFCAVFREHYSDIPGIVVPKNKTKLRLQYEPASSGLRRSKLHDHTENWCDPSALKRPIKGAIALLPQVQQTFRMLVRARSAETPFEVLANWPTTIPLDDDANLTALRKGIDGYCQQRSSSSLLALSAVAGQGLGEKVSKAQARALRNTLAVCGWVMVPDPDLTPMTLKPNQNLGWYRGRRPKTLSSGAAVLGLNLRLGVAIALADGELQDEEVAYLKGLVAYHIDPEERSYLDCLLDWHLGAPVTGAGLKAEIDRLEDTSRQELAKRLIRVASADGELPKAELLALEKTFDRLGLPKSQVAQLLSESPRALPSANFQQETPNRAGPKKKERRSSPSTASSRSSSTTKEDRGVVLDPTAIAATQAATKDIQSVLGEIFGDEALEKTIDAPPNSESRKRGESVVTVAEDYWHNGDLDDSQSQLLAHLLTQETWTRRELEAYCQPLGLLTDGALEAINEAAFEHLGDQLVELDEPILVYHDLLPT